MKGSEARSLVFFIERHGKILSEIVPKLFKLETFAILYLSLDEIDKVMIMPLNW